LRNVTDDSAHRLLCDTEDWNSLQLDGQDENNAREYRPGNRVPIRLLRYYIVDLLQIC